MNEYIIVAGRTFSMLADFVNEKIADGYEPVGGVTVEQYGNMPNRYLQAMYKKARARRKNDE